jgi:hypothetical protein
LRSRWWNSTAETNSAIPFIPTRADNPPGMGGEPCRGRRPCSSCWSPSWICGRERSARSRSQPRQCPSPCRGA